MSGIEFSVTFLSDLVNVDDMTNSALWQELCVSRTQFFAVIIQLASDNVC